jgi:hypothetical protein
LRVPSDPNRRMTSRSATQDAAWSSCGRLSTECYVSPACCAVSNGASPTPSTAGWYAMRTPRPRRAREDTRGRLRNPARPAQPLPPTLRTSHSPDPPTPTLPTPPKDQLDTERRQRGELASAYSTDCMEGLNLGRSCQVAIGRVRPADRSTLRIHVSRTVADIVSNSYGSEGWEFESLRARLVRGGMGARPAFWVSMGLNGSQFFSDRRRPPLAHSAPQHVERVERVCCRIALLLGFKCAGCAGARIHR